MKHFGDITKLSGFDLPIVDCIIGGSPCQDLSVAGRREGLSGERSGLFMEQIRIIKEMRLNNERNGNGTNRNVRFMVWENVVGVLSSGKPRGEDFRIVLEETARIVEPNAVVPRFEKWRKSGCILGNGWSIAWRVHDAQFWGVPQRRNRIALVADFRGHAAPEILFERAGMSRDFESGGEKGQKIARNIDGSIDAAIMGTSGRIDKKFFEAYQHHGWRESEKAGTLTSEQNSSVRGDTPIVYSAGGFGQYEERVGTLKAKGGDLGGGSENLCVQDTYQNITGTICAEILKITSNQIVDSDQLVTSYKNKTVRRLTPLECERLQGFPDGWTDIGEWIDSNGRKHKSSDTARYKALGNSIAIPFWFWLLRRISAIYPRPATLGSLFDGIGGFPYCWEKCNGKGTAIWASEIEEFPIAVTKYHFPENETKGVQNV